MSSVLRMRWIRSPLLLLLRPSCAPGPRRLLGPAERHVFHGKPKTDPPRLDATAPGHAPRRRHQDLTPGYDARAHADEKRGQRRLTQLHVKHTAARATSMPQPREGGSPTTRRTAKAVHVGSRIMRSKIRRCRRDRSANADQASGLIHSPVSRETPESARSPDARRDSAVSVSCRELSRCGRICPPSPTQRMPCTGA